MKTQKEQQEEEKRYYEGHPFYTEPQKQVEKDMETWERRHGK